MSKVKIIGAGLAGVECAYFLAKRGIEVELFEMRPLKMTQAHKTKEFAELVCSNSLRSKDVNTAVGLLKLEMSKLGSLVINSAYKHEIVAGTSLTVDRKNFSEEITKIIEAEPNIKIKREEVTKIDDQAITVIAAGPLISLELAKELQNYLGDDELFFYDAIAPIISLDSINLEVCYYKDRYDKGIGEYLNCPMTKEEYNLFYNELIKAEKHAPKDFEKNVFEGCMPIEAMAIRGKETLRFGPFKPVGLEKNGFKPYAVVQLRPDDAIKSMYNLVGFQTSLKHGEQKRIIRLIPGLENANILRYGVIHKSTYINAPFSIKANYQTKDYPNLYIAGQLSGVEGYVESAASGLALGIYLYQRLNNLDEKLLPTTTAIGSLGRYLSLPNSKFMPMNINYGIIDDFLDIKKKERKAKIKERSIKALIEYKEECKWI